TSEGADPLDRLGARVRHVEAHGRDDLVVPRAARVDLPPDLAELALDRRVDVLCVREERAALAEGLEPRFDLAKLRVGQQARLVEPPGMHRRALAVVGKELGVVRAEEVPDLGCEADRDPPRPLRHAVTLPRALAAASSASSEASRMKPSAASCGNVSPVA